MKVEVSFCITMRERSDANPSNEETHVDTRGRLAQRRGASEMLGPFRNMQEPVVQCFEP